ncbi:unnamed protein product [Mucor fragilis]
MSIQSALLRFYALKQVDHNLLASMLNSIAGSSMIRDECKLSSFTGTLFLDLFNAMAISGKWKTVIRIAKNLEAGSVVFDDEKDNIEHSWWWISTKFITNQRQDMCSL